MYVVDALTLIPSSNLPRLAAVKNYKTVELAIRMTRLNAQTALMDTISLI